MIETALSGGVRSPFCSFRVLLLAPVCRARRRNDRSVFVATREMPVWWPFCAPQLSGFLLATFSMASPTPFLKELCRCWKVSSSSKNSPQDAAKARKTRAAARAPLGSGVLALQPLVSRLSNTHLTSWSHFTTHADESFACNQSFSFPIFFSISPTPERHFC